jgi:hypothetical protein
MDGWAKVIRTGDIEFRVMLKSARLRRALADVWQRLPLEDRHALNDKMITVTDATAVKYVLEDSHADGSKLYGSAVPVEDRYFVFLNADKMRARSAALLSYVVAHELAHVHHGHGGASYRRNKKRCEAEADRTAAGWGYADPEPVKPLKITKVRSMPK